MSRFEKLMGKIPALLSSKASIVIFLFLFVYLVLYALLCAIVPALTPYAPSSEIQLVMGNYTNVLSALGASIAAGAGAAAHASVKALHKKHESMRQTIDALHEKLDRIEKRQTDT